MKLKRKQKSAQHPSVLVLYVTLITHYVKSLGDVNARYEMLPLAVTYNVASITKMGYKDSNNNGIFIKVRGVGDDDDDEQVSTTQGAQDPTVPAHDPTAPSLVDIIDALNVLGDKFERFQQQVWAQFDTMIKQITVMDHKVTIGAEFKEPQVYPSESSEATQFSPHA